METCRCRRLHPMLYNQTLLHKEIYLCKFNSGCIRPLCLKYVLTTTAAAEFTTLGMPKPTVNELILLIRSAFLGPPEEEQLGRHAESGCH